MCLFNPHPRMGPDPTGAKLRPVGSTRQEAAMMERRRAREEYMAMLAERDEITVNMPFKRVC